MSLYTRVVRPLFFRLDPELVHDLAVIAGRVLGSNPITRSGLAVVYRYRNPVLEQRLLNITFRNPVGLAAGFDKGCRLMRVLPAMGFGFEEVGSITAEAYAGNQKPRLTRLPADKGIIVNYGLKNDGANTLHKRLRGRFRIPIGVSIAATNKRYASRKERFDDWEYSARLLRDRGDFLVLNLSCPNTAETIEYCDPKELRDLFKRVKKLHPKKPIFLKLPWSLTQERVAHVIAESDKAGFVRGFIVSNLSKDRSAIRLKTPRSAWNDRPGGISGPVIKERSLMLVREFYRQAGDRYVIVGCGGIMNAQDAYAYIRNGASLVQVLTGMIYEGPGLVRDINKGLVRLLARDGYENVSQAVGIDARSRR